MKLLIFMALLMCACSQENKLEKIKSTGILKVGIKIDVHGLGYYNETTGEYEGLEVELARLLVREITGKDGKVFFVPVTPKTRGQLLDNDEVDMVIATFTITDERKLSYNFSTPYYTDYVGIMVKKDSGIENLSGLSGRKIGVAMTATSRSVIETALKESAISAGFIEYELYSSLVRDLNAGRLDAFSGDIAILKAYRDWTMEILDNQVAPQPYGIATKFSDKKIAAFADECVRRWLSDGTIEELIHRFNL